MRQFSRIMSTYSPDVSGVCSALYELGGMAVIHDASGCNSTYTTFDEPRWYDMDSMVYCSGLDDTDAMLGNDDKLINEVVDAASDLHPNFIAVTGGPVPMMIGTDFDGIAEVIEKRTGIPTFGFSTSGMKYYCKGAGMALLAIAKRFCTKNAVQCIDKTGGRTVNLIGATPLDFSIKENIPSLRKLLENRGYKVASVWAMGSSFEDIVKYTASADANIIVSSCGLPAAKFLQEKYDIPFVVGLPIGSGVTDELFALLDKAISDGKSQYILHTPECPESDLHCRFPKDAKALIIGEQVYANSMRCCLKADYGLQNVHTLCPLSPEPELLLPLDIAEDNEAEIESAMAKCDIIVADPLYRKLLPEKSGKCFIDMPHEAFSGRMFRDKNPCIIGDAVHSYLSKYLV